MEAVDTHCHLYMPGLAGRLREVLENARNAGVTLMICPGVDEATSREALRIARSSESVLACAGLHPSEAGTGAERFADIQRLCFEPGICAVGESGLDLKEPHPPEGAQIDLLLMHAGLARDLDLPLVLHSRSAERRIMEVLPEDHPSPVIMHCYTGPAGPAGEAVRRGWFVSFSGALTFAGRRDLRDILAGLPRGSVLTETDSPYMAPEPVRGRTCEPALIVHTIGCAARIAGEDASSAARRLSSNARRAFMLEEGLRPAVVYVLGRRAYVNLTGRCSNSCEFCIRERTPGLGGYILRHASGDPSPRRVLGSVSRLDPSGFEELVFCGYGEPTDRADLLEDAARAARKAGWRRLRLNTNGLATGIMSTGEASRLLSLFDSVSISLNAHDEVSYGNTCRPSRPGAWGHLLSFVALAKASDREVRLTAVRWEGVDIPAVASLAAGLGLPLSVRGSG